jgi:DNA-directed RNA polymerase specialized sigma24 family protein
VEPRSSDRGAVADAADGLATPSGVVRCLRAYADWWQPATSSLFMVNGHRRKGSSEGLRAGLVESLEERTELCRRVARLSARDRRLLVLWYVGHLHVDDIAAQLRISRRQCFRRRARAVQAVVDMGRPEMHRQR